MTLVKHTVFSPLKVEFILLMIWMNLLIVCMFLNVPLQLLSLYTCLCFQCFLQIYLKTYDPSKPKRWFPSVQHPSLTEPLNLIYPLQVFAWNWLVKSQAETTRNATEAFPFYAL